MLPLKFMCATPDILLWLCHCWFELVLGENWTQIVKLVFMRLKIVDFKKKLGLIFCFLGLSHWVFGSLIKNYIPKGKQSHKWFGHWDAVVPLVCNSFLGDFSRLSCEGNSSGLVNPMLMHVNCFNVCMWFHVWFPLFCFHLTCEFYWTYQKCIWINWLNNCI